MRSLHISLNTTHSGCKHSFSISSLTHSLQVFLPLYAHLTSATTTFLHWLIEGITSNEIILNILKYILHVHLRPAGIDPSSPSARPDAVDIVGRAIVEVLAVFVVHECGTAVGASVLLATDLLSNMAVLATFGWTLVLTHYFPTKHKQYGKCFENSIK